MPETNAERLEEIKVFYYSGKEVGQPDILNYQEIEWLIQQAERVLELEKTIAQRESFIETLQVVHFKENEGEKAENARLEQTIEKQQDEIEALCKAVSIQTKKAKDLQKTLDTLKDTIANDVFAVICQAVEGPK